MIRNTSIFSAYEFLPTPLIIFSNQKVIFLNKKTVKLLELSEKKISDKEFNVFNYILPEYQKEILKRNKQVLNGEKLSPYIIKVRTKKGNIIDIETKSTKINLNGKPYIITIFFEVTDRIKTEDQLKLSKQVLDLVGNSSTDIIFKYDFYPKEGYTFITDSIEQVLGFKKDNYYKDKEFFTRRIISEDIVKIPVSKQKFLLWLRNNNRSILRYQTKSKRIVWLETYYNVIKDSKGRIISITGVSRDVTKEKETETQLNSTEEQLKLIAENANDILYFFTYHPKPKYLFVSESLKRVLGYEPEQLYKDPFFLNNRTVGKNNQFKQHEVESEKQQKKGEIKNKRVEYQIKNSAGEVLWMEDQINPVRNKSGNISFLFGIVRNITELKNKEKELNQKWSDYKLLLDQSPVAFFIHHNGMCMMCNKAALTLLKLKSDKQVIGKFIIEHIVPEQRARAIERMREATAGKEWDFLGYQITNSKKEIFNVEIKTVPITYNGIDCVLSLVKDISERELFEKNKIKAELTEENNRKLLNEIVKRISAEKKLTDQKNKLSAIFENSSHLVWTVNKKYELTFFNRNFDEIFYENYRINPQLGKATHDQINGPLAKENKNTWVPLYERAFAGERIVFERKDTDSKNNLVFREVYLNPIYSSDGQIAEVSCMASDVTSKRINEIKLFEQASRMNAVFESGNQIIFTIDRKFNYTYFNKKYEQASFKMLGRIPELGKNYLYDKKVPGDLVKFWKEKLDQVLEGKTIEFVYERNELSGNLVVRQYYLTPIYNNQNIVNEISCTAKDITEKTISERKILNQSAKLNAIFEGSSHYIWTVDTNNKVTSFNHSYVDLIREIYNTTPKIGEALNRGKMLDDKGYIDQMKKNYERAFLGEKVNFELELKGETGKTIFLDVFLSPIYDNNKVGEVSGIAHDITEKRSAIEELRLSEERSRAIINSIPDLLFTMDKDGRFLDYKIEDQSDLFYKPEQFMGMLVEEVFPGGLGLAFKEHIIAAIHTGRIQNYNYSFPHKGEQNHYETRYIRIDENECLVLIRDITYTKNNEEKLTQSLKEKEVLLKEVHHRVKNNMQIISSILNLQSSYTTDEYILNLLRESQNRIKTMAYIHESLYQNKTFSSINFNDYLSQLTNNIIHSYSVSPEKIRLLVNCERTILNLDVSIPLGLIINELVTNSIKHAFPSTSKGNIAINLKTENKYVFLTVEDNGLGLNSDFNPEQSGSLGLQLVYTLVEQIGGKINFESIKPHGTKVNISFKI